MGIMESAYSIAQVQHIKVNQQSRVDPPLPHLPVVKKALLRGELVWDRCGTGGGEK